MPEENINIVIR